MNTPHREALARQREGLREAGEHLRAQVKARHGTRASLRGLVCEHDRQTADVDRPQWRRTRPSPGDHAFHDASVFERVHGGMSEDEFYDTCGWDPITYTTPHRPDTTAGEYLIPTSRSRAFWKAGASRRTTGAYGASRSAHGNVRRRGSTSIRRKGRSAWCWRPTRIRSGWSSR